MSTTGITDRKLTMIRIGFRCIVRVKQESR
jgi:hypothetical protein